MPTLRATSRPTPTPAASPGPGTSPTRRDRGVVLAVATLTVVSLAGSLLAVLTGLSASWWEAVGPTGRLSVPLPMNAALLVLAVAAGSARRRVALPAAALLALACGVAVVSGFFDGGYAALLAPLERLTQVALVLALTTVAVLAARRAVAVRRT